MRLIVVLLLAANAAFYAFAAGHLDGWRGADATRPAPQVAPEALKVLAVDEDRPAVVTDPVSPAALPDTAPLAPASEEKACLSWRLPSGDADRLVRLFSERFPEFSLERHKVAASGSGWWVFIPMQAEKAEVDRKRSELNQKGFQDHFVIPEGKDRYAISLGVYGTEKAGQNFMAILRDKGVEGARLGQRWSKDGLLQVDATGAAAMQAAVVEAVGRLLPDARVRACQ